MNPVLVDVSENYDMMSRKAADLIAAKIQKKPYSLLCLPAGDSPAGTYKYLIRYAKTGHVDFSRCRFVGLDEWVGLGRNDSGSCSHFIYHHFFEPLRIDARSICFFDACALDLKEECRRVDRFIFEHGSIDLILLGIGMNGHVGFNEPGVDPGLYSHVTELHPVTRHVGQKYFSKQPQLEKGITLGMRHIMRARSTVLIANAVTKAAIVKKVVEDPPTAMIPASLLQTHRNSILFLDKEAASGLGSSEQVC